MAREPVSIDITRHPSIAVLASGGLDSAVLMGELARAGHVVHPLFIECGLRWERDEKRALEAFRTTFNDPGVQPITTLPLPIADLLPNHWSTTGGDVPLANTDDILVYLPGRNAILLSKAFVWCAQQGISGIALAILRGNPFPDATPEFFDAFERAMNLAMQSEIHILRPYTELSKPQVIHRGAGMPLELTLSCLCPDRGRNCGWCSKCSERQNAYRDAGIADPTDYAS